MEEGKKPDKEGFFRRLFGGGKKSACCCAMEIEEIPANPQESVKKKSDPEKEKNSK